MFIIIGIIYILIGYSIYRLLQKSRSDADWAIITFIIILWPLALIILAITKIDEEDYNL